MLPPLVERALALSERLGFERSCGPEVGRLLHVLAGSRGRARVAEIGTGAVVGAAWIVSALPPEIPFFTAGADAARAAAAAELFRDDTGVHVLEGDWRQTLPSEAPFDLLFLGADGQRRPDDADLAIGLLAPGGLVVLDAPARPVRDVWLRHPALVATEVLTAAETATIVGVRR